jgi:AcrR family transcriptional regulator
MVGKEGGFEHALIRYHFPSKEELFKAIISGIYEDLHQANASWLEKVNRMSPREGLARYIDHFQAYNEEKPETLRILVQNISLLEDPAALPFSRYITEFLDGTRRTFKEKLPLKASDANVQRFLDSFNGLVLYYLGASGCQARLLGLDPAGKPYQRWVKKTLISVFLPLLKSIIAGLDESEGNA